MHVCPPAPPCSLGPAEPEAGLRGRHFHHLGAQDAQSGGAGTPRCQQKTPESRSYGSTQAKIEEPSDSRHLWGCVVMELGRSDVARVSPFPKARFTRLQDCFGSGLQSPPMWYVPQTERQPLPCLLNHCLPILLTNPTSNPAKHSPWLEGQGAGPLQRKVCELSLGTVHLRGSHRLARDGSVGSMEPS